MEKKDIKHFLNKKIRIFLINGMHYSGKIHTINTTSLTFTDKFNNKILIPFERISHIEELGGRR